MDDDSEWSSERHNILSPDRLSAIREVLENSGPIIVEHWFYYGSCSPDRIVFDDYDKFLDYLNAKARPGDALYVWSFAQVCRDDNSLVDGKYPDRHGRVPKGGAY
jgi:hypothetical protein